MTNAFSAPTESAGAIHARQAFDRRIFASITKDPLTAALTTLSELLDDARRLPGEPADETFAEPTGPPTLW